MEKTVTVNEKKYVIKKMALGRYGKLLEALDKLPPEVAKELSSVDTNNSESILSKLPMLIGKSWESLLDVISIASGIEKEVLSEECDLLDGTNIVKTIFELNDFLAVKNAMATMFKKELVVAQVNQTKTG